MISQRNTERPGRCQPAFYTDPQYTDLGAVHTIKKQKDGRTFPWVGGAVIVGALTLATTWLMNDHSDIAEGLHELVKAPTPPVDADTLHFDRFPATAHHDASAVDETAETLNIHMLNGKEIHSLIFNSFQHSQGRPKIQELIFYILKDQHPEWRIPEDFDAHSFTEHTKETFMKRILNGSHITQYNNGKQIDNEEIRSTLEDWTKLFKQIISEPKVTTNGALSERMDALGRIIEVDRYYTLNGRPSGKEFSYVIEYLVAGNKVPGGPVYQQLYDTLHDDLKSLLAKDTTLNRPRKSTHG